MARSLPLLASDLQARGLIHSVSRPHLLSHRIHSPLTLYTGIDPTADSPHIGNLLPLVVALRFLVHGHSVITLIGGATAAIGDPSGRSAERQLLSQQQLQYNELGITNSIQRFFQYGLVYASRHLHLLDHQHYLSNLSIVNNKRWTSNLSLIDFLGSVGRHARVSTMLNRESVKARMETDAGISFTEFTYQLLQANDFYHLYTKYNCKLQIGGSDQWGNIVAGLDLIRRRKSQVTNNNINLTIPSPNEQYLDKIEDDVYGLTLPLVTTASGEKFGKSAGNAIWIDPTKTSVFDFYQFWLRTADADVSKYLKFFTLMPLDEIDLVVQDHLANPDNRRGQQVLANEVTELVHSSTGLQQAQQQTALLFAKNQDTLIKVIDPDALCRAFKNDPCLVDVPWVNGMSVADLFAKAGATRSRSEAIKLAQRGGLYLNQERVVNAATQTISSVDLLHGKICILRTGKTKYRIVRATTAIVQASLTKDSLG